MFSMEQRRIAFETFIKFDRSFPDTMAEPSYPNRHTLDSWWREFRTTGEVPVAKIIKESRFSEKQRRAAVGHHLGQCEKLKIEFFYGCDWAGIAIEEFIGMLDAYLRWYRDVRIKSDLDYRSPMQYRRDLGLVA